MSNFFSERILIFTDKFKIPTILGLGIITAGIITGVLLTLKEQSFISKASPDVTAQNITLSNIFDAEVTISYQTSNPTPSFISLGQASPDEQTVLDDRDNNPPPSGAGPKPYLTHYFTIKNLLPKTTYQYKIISGKNTSEVQKFTTAAPLNQQTGFRPVIGSVLELKEGMVYLAITNAVIQSAQIKTAGNFLIPVSQIRKSDLSDIFPLTEDTTAKLTVVSDKGEASALINFKTSQATLPPLKLGQNIDLTTAELLPKPASPSATELNIYDINGDGRINSADNAIILSNIGKNPKNKKADINGDKIVDQEDLDLMAKQINQ